MISRYTRPEMGSIWDEAAQYATWLEVELAAAEAMVELGNIPAEALENVRRAVPPDPERVLEIERRTSHDVIAFLEAIEEQIGADAEQTAESDALFTQRLLPMVLGSLLTANIMAVVLGSLLPANVIDDGCTTD